MVEAAWFLYAYYDAPATSCSSQGCPSFIPLYSVVSLVLVSMLLVVGGLGFWGASAAYVAGAVLSAAALALAGYTVAVVRGYGYLSTASNDAAIGVAFALVALLVNIDAMRSRGGISEQANPMNLPVFG
jgi:hypothetical protein